MDNRIEISLLMDFYGRLLTEKQRNILDQYYNMDLSLSEIAENQNTSRQAIHDLIKRCYKTLTDYEEKLTLLASSQKEEEVKGKLIARLKEKNCYCSEIEELLQEL
ncbi:MAG TPA: putative DNA-binding protein [Clostridiaceae bacterium]|nr:putative DNA-binding protein [Clostridiaceae bacterium]